MAPALAASVQGQQGWRAVLAWLKAVSALCLHAAGASSGAGPRRGAWVVGDLGQGPGQGLLASGGGIGPLSRPTGGLLLGCRGLPELVHSQDPSCGQQQPLGHTLAANCSLSLAYNCRAYTAIRKKLFVKAGNISETRCSVQGATWCPASDRELRLHSCPGTPEPAPHIHTYTGTAP